MNSKTSRAAAWCLATSTLALAAATFSPARAQTVTTLDATTVTATKTEEPISDTLAATSTVRGDTIDQINANQAKDLFIATPGVWTQTRADDPGQSINLRGLQDFGRVAVTIDGARQNFQHSGHNADGQYYIDPNMIGGVDVTRGPVANIYGSGAIGGVVVYRTKDFEDVVAPGQRWGVEGKTDWSTNRGNDQSAFFGAKVGDNIDVFAGGTYRKAFDYKDGDGNTVPNTGSETWSGTAKVTMRPAEGHTIKFGYTQYQSTFDWGQPYFTDFAPFIAFFPPSGPGSLPPGALPLPSAIQANDIYATRVTNQIANGRWLYKSPDNPLVDLDANAYWTRTKYDQTKIDGLTTGVSPFLDPFVSANIGDTRNFNIETAGFDVHNTSRFNTGPWAQALTYGVDGFQDKVFTEGFDTGFTPAGKRTVSGGFVQLKSNYSSWLEVISAVRYDQYRLEGGGFESDGSRISPKFTVGVTPFKGFQPYVSYSEGYRAPALTETIIAGIHPAEPGFEFLPNPSLKPEIGKNKEIGINLKYNDIFAAGDSFRGKVNAYINDIDDYIQLTEIDVFGPPGSSAPGAGGFVCTPTSPSAPFCEQYQNVPHARIQGVEFESMYDTGKWFGGLAASYVHGRDRDSGEPLSTIPPYYVTTTLGNRFTDRITAVVRWQHVGAKSAGEIPADSLFIPTKAYDLVNLYLGYQINPNTVASLSVENLLDEKYSPYMQVWANDLSVPSSIVPFPNPGITFKGSLKVRFGGG